MTFDEINSIIVQHKAMITTLIDVYPKKIKIIHTDKFVTGEDSALSAAKKGKETSLWLAVESLKNNKADAIVSAGNTGAVMASAIFVLGRLPHVDRPALAAIIPSKNEKYVKSR